MPLPDLTLRRINTLVRSHHPNFICHQIIPLLPPKTAMADDGKNRVPSDSATSQQIVEPEKKPEGSKESIPAPPEKPLPGDCCGSGCVRCVWDVYYEELEEYNNNKTSPDSSSIKGS
ncbi:unnamed protein product [Cuscuta epithymum]|uniref:Oxidoreductase-like domain-containing protein n=1 Tax=Cuscuta epithymum TaxID=186058 RepID=A0AAV0CWJ2_9ASTE|nr:unnamed protein product [Cuscuta epithymum]